MRLSLALLLMITFAAYVLAQDHKPVAVAERLATQNCELSDQIELRRGTTPKPSRSCNLEL